MKYDRASSYVATLALADLGDQLRFGRISQDEYERQEILLRLRGASAPPLVIKRLDDPQEVEKTIAFLSDRYERGEMNEDEFTMAVTPWVLSQRKVS